MIPDTAQIPLHLAIALPNVETSRIDIAERAVINIGVSFDPAFQPNRIALHIPSDPGVVIPEVVVVHSAAKQPHAMAPE